MNRNTRLAQITKTAKRDWIPDRIEAQIVAEDVFKAQMDNAETDMLLIERGLL